MSLLQMSISGAVMIFMITVIRAAAINRLPKTTFTVLWGIVLARLLIPFSLPSPFSIYSFANHSFAAHMGTPDMGGAAITDVLPVHPGAAASVSVPDPAASPGVSSWIWAAGLVLCALYFTASYVRCRRRFMTSRPVENGFAVQWLAGHTCRRPVAIRQADCIAAPLTYGIVRPVILMPARTDWSDTKKLQYILTHEYVHIRRFDGGIKLLLAAALCIHWFNPLVWVMYRLANRDIELSCDEKVVRTFGEAVKSAYALTLIDMEEKKSGLTPLCSHFSKNAIEERIEAIMKIKKTTVFTLAAACTVVIALGSTFATSAAPAAAPENVPREMEDIAISLNYAYKLLPDPGIYAKYASCGISISDDGKMLLYDGQKVKTFVDESSGTQAFYYDETGAVNLSVTRSSSGNISGIHTISDGEAQKFCQAFFAEEADREVQDSAGHADGTKYDRYSSLGINYDAEEEILSYKGQRVRLFVDENNGTFGSFDTFWVDEAGTVDLSVLRNTSGQIIQIETISKEKAQEYITGSYQYEQDIENKVEGRVAERMKALYPDIQP